MSVHGLEASRVSVLPISVSPKNTERASDATEWGHLRCNLLTKLARVHNNCVVTASEANCIFPAWRGKEEALTLREAR